MHFQYRGSVEHTLDDRFFALASLPAQRGHCPSPAKNSEAFL
jgi:hypothetical protein